MFQKYDADNNGMIDEKELRNMMIDTYQTLGVDFKPTQQDIDSYMKMVDINKDGLISLDEYEQLVLKSLKAILFIFKIHGNVDHVSLVIIF